jgi:hypothetical protein
MSQRRKLVPDCSSAENTAEYRELLTVLRRELGAHYELPQDLPHQILTLMMALNNQDESAVTLTSPASGTLGKKAAQRRRVR